MEVEGQQLHQVVRLVQRGIDPGPRPLEHPPLAVAEIEDQKLGLAPLDTDLAAVLEMTGLQALERIAPRKAMIAGNCELIEFEYERHRTLCLIGNFEVTTGELIQPTLGPTRTEEDFVRHIEETVATDRDGSWVVVVDNLNIHGSESLVETVAEACEIPTDLGKKGARGVLKSVASRQAFLSESSHRIRFVYLPKHSSWLNQIEKDQADPTSSNRWCGAVGPGYDRRRRAA